MFFEHSDPPEGAWSQRRTFFLKNKNCFLRIPTPGRELVHRMNYFSGMLGSYRPIWAAAGWILDGLWRHSFLAAVHVSKRVFSLWIPLVDPVVLFTPMTLPRFWHHCVRPFRRIFGTSCGAEASAFSGSTTRQVSVVGRGRRAWKTEETGCTPLARPQIWCSFFPLRLVTENTPSAILAPA